MEEKYFVLYEKIGTLVMTMDLMFCGADWTFFLLILKGLSALSYSAQPYTRFKPCSTEIVDLLVDLLFFMCDVHHRSPKAKSGLNLDLPAGSHGSYVVIWSIGFQLSHWLALWLTVCVLGHVKMYIVQLNVIFIVKGFIYYYFIFCYNVCASRCSHVKWASK